MNIHVRIFVSAFLIAYFLLPVYFFRAFFVLVPAEYISFMISGLFFHLSVAVAGLSTILYAGLRVLLFEVRDKGADGLRTSVYTKVFISAFLIAFLSGLFFELVLSPFYYEHPLIDFGLERSYYSMVNFATTFYAAAGLAGLLTFSFRGYLILKDWRGSNEEERHIINSMFDFPANDLDSSQRSRDVIYVEYGS